MGQAEKMIERALAAKKRAKDFDHQAKRELELFIDNDSELYHRRKLTILKSVMTKIERGTYDPEKAPKLWLYLVDAGARKYVKEHVGRNARMQDHFPKALREALAKEYALAEYQAIKRGEYA